MYLEDLKLNDFVDIPDAVINKEKMLAFAREYDPVPIHVDEDYAKKSRFGRLIAPGVMSFLEVWAKYIEVDFFGEQLVAGKSTKIEWFKPVFAEDVLSGRAAVTGVAPRNPYNGIAEVTIEAYNQHGELVLSAVTEAVVLRRPQQ
ncbi:MAG: MaoC family dehydratase N-terminal domain-containing protein [Oscillospiraceae bacterium]|nr:MaoC family dehydratase N-terminal domain-containing protein [Oscillospiraceae bacterium]